MEFDHRALVDQLGGDEQLAREVIELFLQESPAQLSSIRTALERGDARDVYVAAHTLKGAASTLAAYEVTRAAEAIERVGRDGHLTGADDAWRDLESAVGRLGEALRASLGDRPVPGEDPL